MKIIRIIILLVTIPLLSSITFNAADARDCSNPEGFHAKLMCSFGFEGSSDSSDKDSLKKGIEKKGDSFWQKIKNFGGKNVGEAG